ncbi:MAG: glycosyltransferase family 1 protein [bacterium]
MKVAFDITCLASPRTGIGNYSISLLRALAALPEWLEFVLYGDSWRGYKFLKNLDFAEKQISSGFSPFPKTLVSLAWEWLRVSPIGLWGKKPDLYHFLNYPNVPALKKPVVASVYDAIPLIMPDDSPAGLVRLWRKRARRDVRNVTRFIAISSATARDMTEVLDIPAEKIRVIYLAKDTSFVPLMEPELLSPVLARYQVKPPYILSLGTLQPRKNFLRLMDAYALARKRCDLPHTLVIGGGRGWQDEEILRRPAELGIEHLVRFTGRMREEDLPIITAGADLFAFPSLYEGFGLPVVEAMGCGVPVVAANATSLPEVVGDAGLLFSPTDVEAMAEALARPLLDRALWQRMREAGLKQAALFTWESTAIQTMNLYKELLG